MKKSASEKESVASQPQTSSATGNQSFNALLQKPISYKVADTGKTVSLTGQQVIDYLCVKTKSGKEPSTAEIVKFLKLCEARGLDPWVGDAYLVGYDGKDGPSFSLITSEQALLKRAETHEHFDGIQSGLVLKTGKQLEYREGEICLQGEQVVGAWAKVHRKDRRVPNSREVMMGPYNKGFGIWKTNPNGMLCKVARAAALREAFPASVGGLYVEHELDMTQSSDTPKVVYEASQAPEDAMESVVETLEQEVCTEATLTVMPDAEPKDLFDKGNPAHE